MHEMAALEEQTHAYDTGGGVCDLSTRTDTNTYQKKEDFRQGKTNAMVVTME